MARELHFCCYLSRYRKTLKLFNLLIVDLAQVGISIYTNGWYIHLQVPRLWPQFDQVHGRREFIGRDFAVIHLSKRFYGLNFYLI